MYVCSQELNIQNISGAIQEADLGVSALGCAHRFHEYRYFNVLGEFAVVFQRSLSLLLPLSLSLLLLTSMCGSYLKILAPFSSGLALLPRYKHECLILGRFCRSRLGTQFADVIVDTPAAGGLASVPFVGASFGRERPSFSVFSCGGLYERVSSLDSSPNSGCTSAKTHLTLHACPSTCLFA